jgi:uncharacterized protein (TIGR03118 family)
MTHFLASFQRSYLLASLVLGGSALVGIGCSDNDDNAVATGGAGGSSGGAEAGSAGVVSGGVSGGTEASAGSAGAAEAGAGGSIETEILFAVERTDLDSDQAGAAHTDPNLTNAWGIAINPTAEVFWVSSNHGGSTPVYDATGTIESVDPTVPALTGSDPGSPTGQVFNSGTNFMGDKFVVDTEDGQILGWPGTGNFIQRATKDGAIYKGLALIGTNTKQMLVATDFHDGTVDLYDTTYAAVTKAGAFTDSSIPAGFAPFNVMPIGDTVYVTYAKQNSEQSDDQAGAGNGYVSVFTTDGTYTKTLISRGELNSPWAVALAPASFGALANTLLVGNFGDGAIHAFDPDSGALVGQLSSDTGEALLIPGLWDVKVGPTGTTDLSDTLFFTSGPSHESHGVFGSLKAATTN